MVGNPMNIPKKSEYMKSIDVNDQTYEIKIVKQVPKNKKDVLGLCDWENKVIYINGRQSAKGLFRTLVHEVLHAFEFEYNLKLKHKHIYVLERIIVDFLLDNF